MTTARMTTATTFASDARGSVGIVFGLMFTGVLLIFGVAIDYGRAVHVDQRLGAAIDAAALAAGRALIDGSLTDDEIREKSLAVLKENFEAGGDGIGALNDVTFTLNRATGGVTIETTVDVPTTITAIANVDKFTVAGKAAVIFDQKDIELGIQLDITGSMAGGKLADLKSALNGSSLGYNTSPDQQGLLDIMLPNVAGTNKVRIGLAPYSAGVNLGAAGASLVTNNRNAGSGCVYDRVASVANDDLYGAGRFYKGRADLPSAQPCPTARVTPLSRAGDNANERTRLKTIVNGFSAGGTTAGQLGTSWAWNIVSPKWNSFWSAGWGAAPAAANGQANTIKAVILMTDGEYNTVDGQCDSSGCTPYGTRGRKSNDTARDLCTAMKDDGVIVYTIGFQLNHPVAVETLNRCATSERTAFLAQNGDELREAFRSIAQSLTNLRLTQ